MMSRQSLRRQKSKLNIKRRRRRTTPTSTSKQIEFQAYNMLKDQTFGQNRVVDEDMLEKTGMDAKFASVWKAVV